MPTPLVPNTSVSMSHLKQSFPDVASPDSLTSYRGLLPELPNTAEQVSLLDFRGKTAISPTFNSVVLTNATSDHRAKFEMTGNIVNISTYLGESDSVLSADLKSYLTNALYQGNVTFAVSSAFPDGVSFNTSTGVMIIDPTSTNTTGSAIAQTRTLTATNRWGNSVTLTVQMNFDPINLCNIVSHYGTHPEDIVNKIECYNLDGGQYTVVSFDIIGNTYYGDKTTISEDWYGFDVYGTGGYQGITTIIFTSKIPMIANEIRKKWGNANHVRLYDNTNGEELGGGDMRLDGYHDGQWYNNVLGDIFNVQYTTEWRFEFHNLLNSPGNINTRLEFKLYRDERAPDL